MPEGLKIAPAIAPAMPDMNGVRNACPIRAIYREGAFVAIETTSGNVKQKLLLTQYEASKMAYAVCLSAMQGAKSG